MRCIITGFEAFGDSPVNPTELAVKRIDGRVQLNTYRSVAVDRLVLPVCGLDGWHALRRAVAAIGKREKFALVMSGLADGRDNISLERVALNVRDYRIADNCGDRFRESPISSRAPLALKTDVNIPAILHALQRKNVPATISYHAGEFICNETYFRALRRWGNDPRCLGVLFVHFPSPHTYAALHNDSLSQEEVLSLYADVLTTAARVISNRRRPR